MSKLYDKNKKITKNALVLVYLSIGYPKTKKVSKTEITQFVRDFYPDVNDVQQPRHFHWPGTKTKLEKSHKDPNKPLIAGNIIPQCQKCNRGDRNRWVYDDKGRVIKLVKPSFVKDFDKNVRRKIYKILYKEFRTINLNKKNEKKRKK